jgi:hypothetical protein
MVFLNSAVMLSKPDALTDWFLLEISSRGCKLRKSKPCVYSSAIVKVKCRASFPTYAFLPKHPSPRLLQLRTAYLDMKLKEKIAKRIDSTPFYTFEFFPPKTDQVSSQTTIHAQPQLTLCCIGIH